MDVKPRANEEQPGMSSEEGPVRRGLRSSGGHPEDETPADSDAEAKDEDLRMLTVNARRSRFGLIETAVYSQRDYPALAWYFPPSPSLVRVCACLGSMFVRSSWIVAFSPCT